MLSVRELIELGIVDDELHALDAYPLEMLVEFNEPGPDWDADFMDEGVGHGSGKESQGAT